MKVLQYGNRKEPPWYLDASTPEKEAAALKCLFLHLKYNWNCYADMDSIDEDIAKAEKELEEYKALEVQLPTIPEMLLQDAKHRLEQLPRCNRHLDDLKWQKSQWEKVKSGDAKALRRFLESRSNSEYEEWCFEEVDDPVEYMEKHFKDKP